MLVTTTMVDLFYFIFCLFNAVHVLFYTNKMMMMLMPHRGNGFLQFFIVGVWLLLLTCGTHNQCTRGYCGDEL